MKEFLGLRLLLVMISFALPHYAFAKDNKDLLQSLSNKDGGANTLFIENKGQIGDQNGKPNTSVKYLILRPGLNIQLRANSFSYDAYTIERFKRVERLVEPLHSKFDKQNDDSLVYHFSRVDIELVNANPNPLITQKGSSSDYLNYYTHITSQTKGEEGATGVRGYSTITYHDIYPNIDLEWFLDKDGKPEYQFIINPGGDPSRIRLKYHGAQKTELISDAIHIHIKPGIIKEHIPLSYLKESEEKLTIAFTKIAENEYGFKIPAFASNETLIIDPMPNVLWSIYLGGNDFDVITTLDIDTFNNIYFNGITRSNTGIATSNANNVSYFGGTDGFIGKITSKGQKLFTSYIGGSSTDECYGLKISSDGFFYSSGHTTSATGIATSGSFRDTNDGLDAFLQKYDLEGKIIWGTYIGGDQQDWCWSLCIDSNNNIVMGGTTLSKKNLFTLNNYFKSPGFLAKFNQYGNQIWCLPTPGGLRATNTFGGNYYLCGYISDSSGFADANSSQKYYGGGAHDLYLLQMDYNGKINWKTYFGGDGIEDIRNQGILIVEPDNLYISGMTNSTTNIATANSHVSSFQGPLSNYYGDSFIAKFLTNGKKQWSTYIGGNAIELYGSLCKNPLGYIELISSSESDSLTNSFASHVKQGSRDLFSTVIDSAGKVLKTSYFTGNEYEEVVHALYNNIGELFICGISTSVSGIIADSINIEAKEKGGGFLAGFQVYTHDLIQSNQIDTVLCAGEIFLLPFRRVDPFFNGNIFKVQLSDSYGLFSNPIEIGINENNADSLVKCQIPKNQKGGKSYKIRLISNRPADTLFIDYKFSILDNTKPTINYFGNDNFFCTGDSRGLVCDIKADSYQWKRNGEIINGASAREFIAFKNGSYNVITKIGNCESESEVKDIIEYEKPKPIIEGDRETLLSSMSQKYSVGNTNIKRHVWSTSENAIITDSNSSNIVNVKFLKTGPSIIYIVQESLQGCLGMDSIIVMVKSPSGISTNNQPSSVPYSIFPNPTGDAHQIMLQFSEAQKHIINVELLDILGNQMYQSSLNIGEQFTTIPIHNLCSGMYMLRIHMNNEVYMEKVIVN
jgi:hypothetical protein